MDQENKILSQKAEDLKQAREKILGLPPEKALDAILDAEHPAAVVQSFQEDDFYFLIQDIGLNDAMELLAMASKRQWEYILDIETWAKDQIDLNSVTRWIQVLMTAAPKRLVKWLQYEKKEFIEFYLFKNIEIRIREHDQDPSEIGDGFFTDDDTFYVKPLENFCMNPENNAESIPVEEDETNRAQILLAFIKQLSTYDHILFQKLLLETAGILPAEIEEEEYRLRNVRLAEKGFLPFDEAIGIYKPLKSVDIKKLGQKIYTKTSDINRFRSAPQYPLKNIKISNIFTQALQILGQDQDEIIEQLQEELAGLANQIISADQIQIKSREGLRKIVEKACGYLNIGLETLSGELSIASSKKAAAYIKKYPLILIFRIGCGLALELKWRVDRWVSNSWFASQDLPLQFWGEEWTGLLGGLLIKKPLLYDKYDTHGIYKSGLFYREFRSTADITKTSDIVSLIISFDDLLSKMDIRLDTIKSYENLDYKKLILTLWCQSQIYQANGQEGLVPDDLESIDFEKFKLFFSNLWEAGSTLDKQKKIKSTVKETFIKWLSDRTGLETYELYNSFGQAMENLFADLEAEYSEVSTKDLDTRYINMFLFKKND